MEQRQFSWLRFGIMAFLAPTMIVAFQGCADSDEILKNAQAPKMIFSETSTAVATALRLVPPILNNSL